jgi:hypothetical protein
VSLQTAQYTIGTAAVKILEAKANPTQVILHNADKSSNEYIWFGGSADVTITNGIHLDNGEDYQFVLQPGNQLWAISNDAGHSLHVAWQVL